MPDGTSHPGVSSGDEESAMSERMILDGAGIERIVDETSSSILKNVSAIDKFAIVGIQTRGVALAERIRAKIESLSGKKIRMGILDITFYRDDLSTRGVLPIIKETKIEFDIENMSILLVDDVIFTGRTTKAALESLMSFGRPRSISLFVLIDRGNRELPIQPDYLGLTVETRVDDTVRVHLRETDEEEEGVFIM